LYKRFLTFKKKDIHQKKDFYFSEIDTTPKNKIEEILSAVMNVSKIYLDDKAFKGHTELSIINLENNSKIKLPFAYKHFLRKIGASDLSIFDNQSYSLSGLYYANETAEKILTDENEKLPENAFIFSEWQGYQFFYFINDGSENPNTYLYIARDDDKYNEEVIILNYGTFTDWLIKLTIQTLNLEKESGKQTDEGITELKKYL
jgi:hypothetical protein